MIGPDELLTVCFPHLKGNQVIVPGTTKLTFNISLLAGRNIIRKLVKLEGDEIISLDDWDTFYSHHDCWESTTEKHNAVFQGIVEVDVKQKMLNTG